jgi:hypothetical protein
VAVTRPVFEGVAAGADHPTTNWPSTLSGAHRVEDFDGGVSSRAGHTMAVRRGEESREVALGDPVDDIRVLLNTLAARLR